MTSLSNTKETTLNTAKKDNLILVDIRNLKIKRPTIVNRQIMFIMK